MGTLSSPWANKLPPGQFKILTHLSEHLLPFFCTPLPVFWFRVESLSLISISGVWLFVCIFYTKASYGWTSPVRDGCTWVPLVPARSELMALMNIVFFFLKSLESKSWTPVIKQNQVLVSVLVVVDQRTPCVQVYQEELMLGRPTKYWFV